MAALSNAAYERYGDRNIYIMHPLALLNGAQLQASEPKDVVIVSERELTNHFLKVFWWGRVKFICVIQWHS